MRRGVRLLLASCALVAVPAAGWVAWRWTFVARLLTYPHDRPVTSAAWYTPTAPIAGGFTAPLPARPPVAMGFDGPALARAATWARERNSAAFLVLRDGTIALERYWQGAAADSPTLSNSMAKTLVALLLGQAIERGEIPSLETPIGALVAEWRDQPRGAVTLRQLLGMASGLRCDNDTRDPFSDLVQMHLAADLLPVVLALDCAEPPGRSWRYNNANTQLLGLALERSAGRRYWQLLGDRLWRPIGARDAAIWLDRSDGNAKVYGGVLATARDWARVGELVRRRGRVGDRQVVPAAWFEVLEAPSPHRGDYGLHLWLGAGDPARGVPDYVYLDGKDKQRVYVVRELRVVVVRTGENARDWNDDALVALVAAAISG